jgi:hypothetical protein
MRMHDDLNPHSMAPLHSFQASKRDVGGSVIIVPILRGCICRHLAAELSQSQTHGKMEGIGVFGEFAKTVNSPSNDLLCIL